MQPVRYTFEEFSGNIKFVFWFVSIMTAALVVCQLLLMKLEQSSVEHQEGWAVNEGFASNLCLVLSRTDNSSTGYSEEYVEHTSNVLAMFDNPIIQDGPFKIDLNRWRNAVNKSLELSGGSAQDKYEIISEITVQAGEFREKFISKSDKLQSDINVVNLIILFLPVLLMCLMIYVGFFSKYGGK